MPLFWGQGYLGRALAVMERAVSGDGKLSKDMVKTEIFKGVFHFDIHVSSKVLQNHQKQFCTGAFLHKSFKFLLIMKLYIIYIYVLFYYLQDVQTTAQKSSALSCVPVMGIVISVL